MTLVFLVTGAAGFVGSAVVRQLLAMPQTKQVRAVDLNRVEGEADTRLVWFSIDLTNDSSAAIAARKSALRGVDVVIHTAGVVWLQADRALLTAVHVTATETLLRDAAACDVRAFVLTSSTGALTQPRADSRLSHWLLAGDGSDATSDIEPHTPLLSTVYGATKLAAERLVLAHGPSRLRTAAVRLPSVYGLGDRLTVDVLLARLSPLVPLAPIGAPYDYVYVENAAHGHIVAALSLLESDRLSGAALNVCDQDPAPDMLEHWNALLATVGVPFRVARMPRALATVLATLSESLYALATALGVDVRRRWPLFFMMTHAGAGYATTMSVRMEPTRGFDYRPLFDRAGSFRDIRDRLERQGRLQALLQPPLSLLDQLGGPNPTLGEQALTAAGLVATVAAACVCGAGHELTGAQWSAVLFLALIDGSGAVQCATAQSKRWYFAARGRMSERAMALLCVEVVAQLALMQWLFGDVAHVAALAALFVALTVAAMRLVDVGLQRPFGMLAYLVSMAAMRAASPWTGREWFPIVICAKYFCAHFPSQ